MTRPAGTPIADFAAGYARAGISRLHMPGHKGCGPLGCERLDITEIKGADELYEAEGIIAASEWAASQLFGTAETYYSTEGSSQCIRAMLFLAMQAGAGPGRRVLLAARNAHMALLYAAALLGYDIEWLWPAPGEDAGLCACPVTAARLAAALDALCAAGRRPFGFYLTSPDYLGGVQDAAALAAVCHARGMPLLVDNAHGAYLHFLPGGSRHPIALGADICCDSAHKTLPVLTGGAYLHIGQGSLRPGAAAVRGALGLFGSTSPSYLILQSLDLCNRKLSAGWPEELAACIDAVDELKAQLAFLTPGAVRPSEPLKLVLDGAAFGCTGHALAERLRAHRVECEYADGRWVVLLFAPGNPPRDYARVLAAAEDALARPAGAALSALSADALTALAREAAPCCTIRQAVFAKQARVPVGEAAGRICALPTVSCPPAIPIVVSGERFGPAALALCAYYGVEEAAGVCEAGGTIG